MSESAARIRQPIDLDEFERRLRGPSPVSRVDEDPLAELARLVGSGAPFGQRQAPAASVTSIDDYRDEPVRHQEPHDAHEQTEPFEPTILRPAFDAAPAHAGEAYYDEAPQQEQPASYGGRSEPQIDFGRFEQEVMQTGPSVETPSFPMMEATPSRTIQIGLPQSQGDFGAPRMDEEAYAPEPAYLADEARDVRKPKRTIFLMSAALVLVFGAIGMTLVIRGGSKSAGDAPTILAASGPVKVQPANPGGLDIPNQSSSVLDKGKVDRVSNSRVVSHEEQPVDLTKTPPAPRNVVPAVPVAPDRASGNTDSSNTATGFPEPKRVKTVSVRPDGSVISGDAPATEPRAPLPTPRPSIASVPPSIATAKPAAPTTAAKPVVPAIPPAPKATARVTTPNKVETASLSDAPLDTTPRAKPAAAKPAPAASTGGAGGFAVQLAAPPSEQEARETISRLQKKFASQLGSHHPSVVKATVGDKSIYRVRVGGLSKDDAASLCTSIQSGGGACFVAKN